ncbi:MFS transporter [Candidatus Gracilibacteria bacterium]|nr:MFS transporter [Candidatus Gracilibacteria bacterium]
MKNTAEIGVLVTASAIFSIFISYFVGKHVDKFDPKKMILWGVRTASICCFTRPLFLHPIIIAATDAINKIVDPIFRIPYDKARYKLVSENKEFTRQATIKQFVQELYYTATVIIILLITLFYSQPSKEFFIVFFLISAASMLFMQKMASVHFRRRDRKAILKEEKNGVMEEVLEEAS